MNQLKAKEILDSNGKPTIEVELKTGFGKFKASVPSGVSTGSYEAVEVRDDDGRGVQFAKGAIEKIIAPVLERENLSDQERIDDILLRLDGTENKSHLGANALLPVSIAVCRAGAKVRNIPLYEYIHQIAGLKIIPLPKPSFNLIEGGKHSLSGISGKTALAFQEFMVIPQKESFAENLKIGKTIYKKLKDVLKNKYKAVGLSAEGAYTAPMGICAALDLIMESAREVGHAKDIKIAIDAAASSFYENGGYRANGKNVTTEELSEIYLNFSNQYPIISIEDPLNEEDFQAFSKLQKRVGDNVTIFGDDLTVSSIDRTKEAYKNKSCSGLILKPNQVGTVSEIIKVAKLAKSFGWKTMVANRAGETEDDFIADFAAGVGADFIKSGAPAPKVRMVKYDRLVKIEEELKHG